MPMKISSNEEDDGSDSNISVNLNSDSESDTNVDTINVNQNLCDTHKPAEIEELQEWAVSNNIPHKHVTGLLKILRKRLLPILPKCAATFLKCDLKINNIEAIQVCDGSVGEFVYFGIETRLKAKINEQLHDSGYLELIFNIDGMSPFKSSQVCMWPILCKVYLEQNVYKPFSVAIYSGNGKPKYPSKYLYKFVQELNLLLEHGISIENKKFGVKIKFFTCDCPARSFLKCVVEHTAFKGCERCNVIGAKVDGTTVFLQTDAEKKTNDSFRAYEDPDYHTDASLLCAVEPLDMTLQFVLDPMHLLYLGCMKRIMVYLLGPSTRKCRLSATLKGELIRRRKLISQDIPVKFPRKASFSTKATLHPIVIYYKTNNKTELQIMNFCIISDSLKHTAGSVNIFQEKVIKKFKEECPWVTNMIYFSDGAPTQYKNKNDFINLCYDETELNMKITSYNFFATSHGKSACDGIGAVAERAVRKATLQRDASQQILSSKQMFDYLDEHVKGIKFVWSFEKEVEAPIIKLNARFTAAKTIPNTRKYHAFIPINESTINVKITSFDTESKTVKII